MKPAGWKPSTVDAIATGSADGKRIIIKAVNYSDERNTLLARLRGASVPEKATVKIYTVSAGLTDAPSMDQPDKIRPVETARLRTKPGDRT